MEAMKTVWVGLTVVIGLASVQAHAEDFCKTLGEIAAAAQKNHQVGTPMDKIMAAVDHATAETPPAIAKAYKAAVIDAYSTPRYSTKAARFEAVQDTRNKWEFKCYQARNGE